MIFLNLLNFLSKINTKKTDSDSESNISFTLSSSENKSSESEKNSESNSSSKKKKVTLHSIGNTLKMLNSEFKHLKSDLTKNKKDA